MAKLNQNPQAGGSESLFVNEERLSGRQWLVVAAILALAAWLAPVVWQRVERFETGPDYRIPYTLSKDYWLYKRRAAEVAGGGGRFEVILDRRAAIEWTLATAQPDEVVVIAGRGAEREQELAAGRVPFDDREVARASLRRVAAGS